MTHNKYEWHRWFAWRPTFVGWIRFIERRKQWACRPLCRCGDGAMVGSRTIEWWEYRAVASVSNKTEG